LELGQFFTKHEREIRSLSFGSAELMLPALTSGRELLELCAAKQTNEKSYLEIASLLGSYLSVYGLISNWLTERFDRNVFLRLLNKSLDELFSVIPTATEAASNKSFKADALKGAA
jgi:hypothetical protein